MHDILDVASITIDMLLKLHMAVERGVDKTCDDEYMMGVN